MGPTTITFLRGHLTGVAAFILAQSRDDDKWKTMEKLGYRRASNPKCNLKPRR